MIFAVACRECRPQTWQTRRALRTVGHVAIGIKTKHWWVIWTLGVGCAGESASCMACVWRTNADPSRGYRSELASQLGSLASMKDSRSLTTVGRPGPFPSVYHLGREPRRVLSIRFQRIHHAVSLRSGSLVGSVAGERRQSYAMSVGLTGHGREESQRGHLCAWRTIHSPLLLSSPLTPLTPRVVCTVIAPTFYSAANYVILGK